MSADPFEGLVGSQVPTHEWVPEYTDSRGDEAIEVAEIAGLVLDPGQQQTLRDGLAVDEVPRTWNGEFVLDPWKFLEIELEQSRQNGKSAVLEARTLAGIYVFRERLIVYSAHKGETAMEAFERIVDMIFSDGELKSEIAYNGIKRTNGKESIRTKSGQRTKFRTRTAGGGRGLSGDCVLLDEDQDLDDEVHSALLPVVSARQNPQLWYAGSAGGPQSSVKGRLIRRGERKDPGLVVKRWAADEDDNPADPATWAKTNPALGTRIPVERVAREQRSMSPSTFARERLGVGDYPREDGEDWVIPSTRWERAEDPESEAAARKVLAVDVTRGHEAAAIGLGGVRVDGRRHGQVLEHSRGTRWVAPLVARLRREIPGIVGVVVDPAGPGAPIITELEELGVKVTPVTRRQFGTACGWLHAACLANPPDFRHNGGSVLTAALAQATVRETQDLWTWRRTFTNDITPLIAVTLAVGGIDLFAPNQSGPATPPRSARQPDPSKRGRRGADTADLASASF